MLILVAGIVACSPVIPQHCRLVSRIFDKPLLATLTAYHLILPLPCRPHTSIWQAGCYLQRHTVQTVAVRPSGSAPESCDKSSPLQVSTSPPLSLTVESLENAEYFDANDQRRIRLSNGVFDSGNIHIKLEGQPAFGNLNGDKAIDNVVVLQDWHGGTGRTRSIVAVLNRNGEPFQIASVSHMIEPKLKKWQWIMAKSS